MPIFYANKVNYPFVLEVRYFNQVNGLLKSLFVKDIKEGLIQEIKNSYNREVRKDDFTEDFDNFFRIVELKITIKLRSFINRIVRTSIEVNDFNENAVKQSLKNTPLKNLAIGTTQDVRNAMEMFVSDNVRLIKSISEDLLGRVQEIVFANVRRGSSYTTLSQELQKSFTISEKRARLIAKDQINKLNADLTRQRHKELGITNYKWSTSQDERVRKSHQVLESRICNYDNVNVYKDVETDKKWLPRTEIGAALYHPGQEVLCRCTAIAIIKL